MTGSKQGITCPPGNVGYNMSKAALKTFAEGLEHELRNTEGNKLKTCLLVPGWTNSDLVLKIQRAAAAAEGKDFDPGVSL